MAKQSTQTRGAKVPKTVSKKTESSSSAVAESAPVPKATTTKRARKTPVVVESESVDDRLSDHEEETSTVGRKTRRVVTRDTIAQEGEDIVQMINDEISTLRESETKTKGVKFLRSLCKRVKSYNSNVARVTKQRSRAKRGNSTNSGFLKPVRISKEMCDFTGWDPNELKSRVDVTKYICKYINDNNLQNPADRRQIQADDKLCKLLDYDPATHGQLKYYNVQTFLKPHFLPVEPVESTAEPTETTVVESVQEDADTPKRATKVAAKRKVVK